MYHLMQVCACVSQLHRVTHLISHFTLLILLVGALYVQHVVASYQHFAQIAYKNELCIYLMVPTIEKGLMSIIFSFTYQ